MSMGSRSSSHALRLVRSSCSMMSARLSTGSVQMVSHFPALVFMMMVGSAVAKSSLMAIS
eukprot:5123708-Pyramimonas_sp.AAC.1